jgi:hypothetical protein
MMSALPPKADMCGAARDVGFGPEADIDHVSHSNPSAKKETAWWRSPRNLVKRFAQAAVALAPAFRKARRSALIAGGVEKKTLYAATATPAAITRMLPWPIAVGMFAHALRWVALTLRTSAHSMTSSARASSAAGISMPDDFASHFTGTTAGAPLSLIKTTRNFAGWVPLAFRSMT